MGEPALQDDAQVFDMAEYLRQTIHEMDQAKLDIDTQRNRLAFRLAVIEAATDPATTEAIEDYERRVASGEGYPDAKDAEKLLGELYAQFVH